MSHSTKAMCNSTDLSVRDACEKFLTQTVPHHDPGQSDASSSWDALHRGELAEAKRLAQQAADASDVWNAFNGAVQRI